MYECQVPRIHHRSGRGPRRASASPRTRGADRRGGAEDRRRGRLRGGVDAPRRHRARRRDDDALPLREEQARAGGADGRRGDGRAARARGRARRRLARGPGARSRAARAARSCATRGRSSSSAARTIRASAGRTRCAHVEQSLTVAERTGLDLTGQFEITALMDDFVFGHAMRTRGIGRSDQTPEERLDAVVAYMERQLATGGYPACRRSPAMTCAKASSASPSSRPIPTGSSAGSRSCWTGSR